MVVVLPIIIIIINNQNLLDHDHLASNGENSNKKQKVVSRPGHMAALHEVRETAILFEVYFVIILTISFQNTWTLEK